MHESVFEPKPILLRTADESLGAALALPERTKNGDESIPDQGISSWKASPTDCEPLSWCGWTRPAAISSPTDRSQRLDAHISRGNPHPDLTKALAMIDGLGQSRIGHVGVWPPDPRCFFQMAVHGETAHLSCLEYSFRAPRSSSKGGDDDAHPLDLQAHKRATDLQSFVLLIDLIYDNEGLSLIKRDTPVAIRHSTEGLSSALDTPKAKCNL